MPLTGEVPVLGDIMNDVGLETARSQPKDNLHQNLHGRLHRSNIMI